MYVDFAKNRKNLEMLRFPPPPDKDAMPEGIELINVGDPDMKRVKQLAEEQFEWSKRGAK